MKLFDNLPPSGGFDSPLEIASSRRSFLHWSSAAIVGALAVGASIPGLTIDNAFAERAANNVGRAVDLGSGDIGVLNYAYALEQLEAAFYTQVLSTPYANMSSAEKSVLNDIRSHEIAHRELFKAALKGKAIPALEADFTKVDFNDRMSVLKTAQTFEDLGVSAYNGAGRLLKNGDYLLLAGKIVSVEARHAAAIRILLNPKSAAFAGDDIVDDQGLDKAAMPGEVLAAAGPFIKTRISADNLVSMKHAERN